MLFDVIPSAKVRVSCDSSFEMACRVLLDTCTSVNLLTKNLARPLNPPKKRCSLTIGAVNGTATEFCTRLTIKLLYSEFLQLLTFFIVPSITKIAPNKTIQRGKLSILQNIKLDDIEFHKPVKIDMFRAHKIDFRGGSDMAQDETWID